MCRVFESPDSPYEILDRNYSSDPFEPDIVLMDADEWVFRIVCYYTGYVDDGAVDIWPHTFPMRKWVTDHDELPTFFVLGVEGTPQHPEEMYFTRFFNINKKCIKLTELRDYTLNVFRIDMFRDVIEKDFERIFSA